MKKFTKIEKKIANFLEKIGIDKALHYLIGYSAVATGLIYGLGPGGWTVFGIVAAAFIKEKFIDEKFDFADVLATFFGAASAMLVYVPYDIFLK